MKTKIVKNPAFTLLIGIVLGAMLVLLFKIPDGTPIAGPGKTDTITQNDALTFRNNYYKTAQPLNKKLKGFAINKETYNAMTRLLGNDDTYIGFRILLGLDLDTTKSIIYGINSDGTDALRPQIYQAIYHSANNNFGPCPTVCDDHNSINFNE